MALSPGQVLNGKYRVIRLLGDGGMGSVYEAHHEVLGTNVALKLLHAELSRTGVAKRFLQEARASARIKSRHVVGVSDADQTPDGMAFIVLEYLEGKTLREHYEQLGKEGRLLPFAEALDFAMQMFEGVEAAHAAGIIHRDLKPDNVMITVDSKGLPLLKLLDFGIAKVDEPPESTVQALTRPGALLGTPEYMAPEQVYSAGSADARSDIFSLGVILFEMLSGRRPVVADDPQQIAVSYLTGAFTRLDEASGDVPPGLVVAVHRAIAAQPRDRFASVAEMRAAVEPYAPVRQESSSRLSLPSSTGRISGPIPETRSYPDPHGVQSVQPLSQNPAPQPLSGGAPRTVPEKSTANGTTLLPQRSAPPSPAFTPDYPAAAPFSVQPPNGAPQAAPMPTQPLPSVAPPPFVPEYPPLGMGLADGSWVPPPPRASLVPQQQRSSRAIWVGVAVASLLAAVGITLGVLYYLGWLDPDPPVPAHKAPPKPHPTLLPPAHPKQPVVPTLR